MKVQYYSDKLKKYYDNEAACVAAEAEWDKQHAAELKAKEERAIQAKEVEEKFKAAHEAYKKADAALCEFCAKYGSFHTTIQNPVRGANKTIFDYFLNSFF